MKQLDPKAVWLFFISNTIIFLIIAIGASSALRELYGNLIIVLLAVLALVLAFVVAKLTYHFYRYEMTDVVFKKEQGIIWKKYISIPYDRIQNVDIHRGVFARMLGLSDIQIQTAGFSATVTRYGVAGINAEGRLIGVSKEEAERLRDELIQRARTSRSGQGL